MRRHAYTSTLDESKIRWAIRLLELELRDRPGRLHYVIEYARNLLLLNDPRGHEVMGHAWTNDGSSLASDDEQIEAEEVRRSIDAITAAIGEAPVGWMSPGGMGSPGPIIA